MQIILSLSSLMNSIAFFSRWSPFEVHQIIYFVFVSPVVVVVVVVVVVGRNQTAQPSLFTTSCVHLHSCLSDFSSSSSLFDIHGSFIDIVHTTCPARSCIDFAHFHALVEFGGYGFYTFHPFVTDSTIGCCRRYRFAGNGSGRTCESQ